MSWCGGYAPIPPHAHTIVIRSIYVHTSVPLLLNALLSYIVPAVLLYRPASEQESWYDITQ